MHGAERKASCLLRQHVISFIANKLHNVRGDVTWMCVHVVQRSSFQRVQLHRIQTTAEGKSCELQQLITVVASWTGVLIAIPGM